jgi:molybdopterin-binding protein
MKISARNMLKGKVKKVKPGAVNTEVILELPGGGEIVSIITKESAEKLGLASSRNEFIESFNRATLVNNCVLHRYLLRSYLTTRVVTATTGPLSKAQNCCFAK